MTHKRYWIQQHERIVTKRKEMFQHLTREDFKEEWINKRPKEHLWSIDEILRHMLASEIRYVHQSFNQSIENIELGVPAQWVNEHFFRIEERNHYSLEKIVSAFSKAEETTKILLNTDDDQYEKIVKAPWGEKIPVYKLLESFNEHETYHRGQIFLLLNFFRGPPDFVKEKIKLLD